MPRIARDERAFCCGRDLEERKIVSVGDVEAEWRSRDVCGCQFEGVYHGGDQSSIEVEPRASADAAILVDDAIIEGKPDDASHRKVDDLPWRSQGRE